MKIYGLRKLEKTLAWWVDKVRQSAIWVLIAATLLTCGLLYYTAGNLGISTDTADMLSESLPFRRLHKEYKKAFPQYSDTLLIVIDGDTPELGHDAGTALVRYMKSEEDCFDTVYYPGGGEFFRQNALLYLSLDELEDLADRLANMQPFLAKLSDDQSLHGLFTILGKAIEANQEGVTLDMAPLYHRLAGAVDAALDQRQSLHCLDG